MHLIKYAIRRIRRHWRLYVYVLLGLSFCSGLLAGLPAYSQTIATQSLQRSLEEGHPVERNIEIFGTNNILTGALLAYVDDNIGEILTERLEIRTVTVEVNSQNPVIPVDSDERLPPNLIKILSFDKLKLHSSLIEGQWPEYTPPATSEDKLRAMMKPPDIQAVIGTTAAQDMGLKTGDLIVDNTGRQFPIVGIVEPNDPQDDAWWGDTTIFEVYRRPGINEDTVFLSLLIHPSWLRESYPSHETSWRILVKQEEITPENAISLEQKLINFKNKIDSSNASLRTNLPNLLKKYREDISTTRIVILLLSSQSFLFVLYGLVLIESLIWERARNEFSTMIGRGSGIRQLVAILGVEGLIIAIISGLITGPLLAGISLFIWSKFAGLYFETPFRGDGLQMSILGSGIGWLILLLGSISISRSNILSWKLNSSRLDKSTVWQKYFLDIILVGISGLIYWQLTNSGSFVMQRFGDTDVADPILLLAPTLFLFSISLLFLRLYPLILSVISRVFRHTRGIILPLSLIRLSRHPLRPSQMILLISVSASTLLFSTTYESSLKINQRNISHYLSGADIRIARNDLSSEELSNIPGIQNITHVYRRAAQTRSGKPITIVGIDPNTFPEITSYPPGLTNLTIQAVTDVLRSEGINETENSSNSSEDDAYANPYINNEVTNPPIPGVFSFSTVAPNIGIGDQQEITVLSTPLNFNIRGLIQNFPTVGNQYVLTNIAGLNRKMDLDRSQFHWDHELWMSVDPERFSEIINIPFIQEYLISDVQHELRTLQDNAFTQGAIGAFSLNSLILILISLLIFSILTYFTESQRKYDFGILRAEGLSSRQLISILFTEGFIVIILGIIIGTTIGIGLTYVMRSYLNIALTRSFPQMVVYKLYFDREQIILGYAVLMFTYLLSLVFVIWSLTRIGIHQVMRIGDE